jgi:hypothetical protein
MRPPRDLGITDRRGGEEVSARAADTTCCDEILRWADDGGAVGPALFRAVRVVSSKDIILGLRALAVAPGADGRRPASSRLYRVGGPARDRGARRLAETMSARATGQQGEVADGLRRIDDAPAARVLQHGVGPAFVHVTSLGPWHADGLLVTALGVAAVGLCLRPSAWMVGIFVLAATAVVFEWRRKVRQSDRVIAEHEWVHVRLHQ